MAVCLNTKSALILYQELLNSEYFVDKSAIIENISKRIRTNTKYVCITKPAVPLRSHIMMEFILHMVLTESIMYLLEKIKENKTQQILFHCGIILLVLYIGCNYVTITTGYKNNYRINQENHGILLQAKEDYNAGKSVREIVLYKLYDDNYANMMPYQEGYKNIEVWMKRYYELPDEVTFQYCLFPNG